MLKYLNGGRLVAILHASSTDIKQVSRKASPERTYMKGIYKFEDASLVDIIEATTTLAEFLNTYSNNQ